MDDKKRGIYAKYIVDRVDGKDIPNGCVVLEFNDPIARPAILNWANRMLDAGYEQVYIDVIAKLSEISEANKS